MSNDSTGRRKRRLLRLFKLIVRLKLPTMSAYTNFTEKNCAFLCYTELKNQPKARPFFRNFCIVSVFLAFLIGLSVGILIPVLCLQRSHRTHTNNSKSTGHFLPSPSAIRTIFLNNSYGFKNNLNKSSNSDKRSIKQDYNEYPTVSFIDRQSFVRLSQDLVEDGIYWGSKVEKALPEGYGKKKHELWTNYVQNGVAVKLQAGCGRMQNRMVVFQDGTQGCVRYRQNIDQIQGELFSFYLAQILKLPNLAPSTVSVVDLKSSLWQNLAKDIAAAQWNSNKPIVLTQFIGNLDSATIPPVFKPAERHLNKYDVHNMTKNEILDEDVSLKKLVELAQWSDLIIFDYLTANLDRIVNNLYNYQWNVNIMDAPAHNLAKKLDSDLLLFLDNESGLLHGYRLLKKYEIYHSLLLDNLCIFRKQTTNIIRELKEKRNIGTLMRRIFEKQNNAQVKDVLPTLPDKSVKILNERIERVHNQIVKCQTMFREDAT
ncbi:extracellular serine/threonine protein kinase four-jointed [Agrilus planipennis]|uniref:Extracellular serine/threonine protein kinase four-jointed n=1 Tax=Agrilus planipennis TaxID=224129 RepID=A0A1W4WG50_AGRPL|nr:extracellular serine/threonine protein kinase four-jointed [Agrilus planipennis]